MANRQERVQFSDLFVPYEARIGILQRLCAWDLVKLELSMGGLLDEKERSAYIHPVRDLFHDPAELDSLVEVGLKIVLLGNDVAYLNERLKDPARYLRAKSAKRLQIYIVGLFPTCLRDQAVLNRLLKICVWDKPDLDRVAYDEAALQAIRAQHPNSMFMMSFGKTIDGRRIEDRGIWSLGHQAPDHSIDLRVYTPCFKDRAFGQAVVSPAELPRLSGHSRGARRMWLMWEFIRIFTRTYSLESAVYLNAKHQNAKGRNLKPLQVRFAHTENLIQIFI